MPELPTGTVTFLFTDIEGSTRLLDELGADAYADALAGHRRIVRDAIAQHNGVEVDTQGDAFFVAFADAEAAVAAAKETQSALGETEVRVRMGLHTGTARLADGGYVGSDVHLGARIAAAAHGGQVLLSQATRGLIDGVLTDLGDHRLKDFAEPVRIYQLGGEPFAPLKTISNTNLPRPASSFIGRERETDEVTALLKDNARLLTLTGPGGTGKTRLSIEAASELVPAFTAGVFWIPLAAVRDPALVMDAIARTLGAKADLPDHIGSQHLLLLVDNLEQVVDAAPDLAALVEACPNLRVLTTSRERLRVRGEVEYAVPPLADPEAIELFATRSGLLANEAIAELCRRLDNLPLAVELAAARTSVLTPAQVLERLSSRLDMLKGGRDADPRQQTLRATIEWSHDLLDKSEQDLFAKFSVFVGGATLEASEKIIDADIDVLQGLVDKSLVRHFGDRFWMLETIREFALDQLAGAGAAEELRRRHAEFFLAQAEEMEPSTFGAGSDEVNDAMERDHPNYRAALEYFESTGELEYEMRLAAALGDFWDDRSHQREALARYSRVLQAAGNPPAAVRAKVLTYAAGMTVLTGDLNVARQQSEEALSIYRALGDEQWIGLNQWNIGYVLTEQKQFEEALQRLEEARTNLQKTGDNVSLMWLTRTQGHAYSELGDYDSARRLYAECLDLARAAGDRGLQAQATGSLAWLAVMQGKRDEAIAYERAALPLIADSSDPTRRLERLVSAAEVFVALGDFDVATKLTAHGEARHLEIGFEEPWVTKTRERLIADLRSRMTSTEFDTAWSIGRTLDSDAAFELAYRTLDQMARDGA
jgi:predicted ATPase